MKDLKILQDVKNEEGGKNSSHPNLQEISKKDFIKEIYQDIKDNFPSARQGVKS